MVRLNLGPRQEQLLETLVTGLPVLDPVLGPWVAGGSVRAVAVEKSLDSVNDVDVWFRDTDQWIATAHRFRELGYEELKAEHKGVLNFRTQQGKLIQLITSHYYESAKDVIDDFSITACQFITDGHHIWAGERSVEHAESKLFVLNNGPVLSQKLVDKYLDKYGYTYNGDRGELEIQIQVWYEEGASAIIG